MDAEQRVSNILEKVAWLECCDCPRDYRTITDDCESVIIRQ